MSRWGKKRNSIPDVQKLPPPCEICPKLSVEPNHVVARGTSLRTLSSCGGMSALVSPLCMTSDASGSWGCGAWHGNSWFQIQWDDRAKDMSIACKELIPLCFPAQREDNQVVVAGLRSRSSRDKRCDAGGGQEERRRGEAKPNITLNIWTPVGPADESSVRLDLSSLASSVQHYFQEGLAQSTQKSYDTALRRFHAFCTKFNISAPFPVTEHLLCCFASFLEDQGLAPQTGKVYLSAIRSMKILLGLPDPRDQSSLPILKRVQAGISRARARAGPPSRIWLPITVQILEQIHLGLAESSHPHAPLAMEETAPYTYPSSYGS